MKPYRLFFLSLAVFFSLLGGASAKETFLTPLILEVLAPPVPFKGSDGLYHLVYELQVTNATELPWRIDRLEVRAEGATQALAAWSGEALKKKMGLLGTRGGADSLQGSQSAIVWVPLTFPKREAVPAGLSHHLVVSSGEKKLEELGGTVKIPQDKPIIIAPPLRGSNWIAADGCCESSRHVRALLPIGGKLYTSQRYAIDWEQLGPERTIYHGDPKKVESFYCYGKEIHAVADGKIVFALDGLPNQIPGALPPGLKVEQADGNHVIQELAPGQYGLYAHMQPGSVKVKSGDTVKAGQLLGLVGNSGNTSAPHLHFHVMDRPATLASSGLPYLFSNFELMGRTPGTAAFDEAEEKGIPIPIIPEKNDGLHRDEYPLDQSLINFSETVP